MTARFGDRQPLHQAIADAAARLESAGVDEPRREAQLLLALTLGADRGTVISRGAELLSTLQYEVFAGYVARRCKREPFAYIAGERYWLDFRIHVNRNVLIPRPETELLVDL